MSIRRGAIEIKLITSSENIYVGQSLNGKKHGIGTLYYNTGAIHICNWQNDIAHGHGIYQFADGTEYVGDWRNNMFHGRCNEIYYKNGDYYKGEVNKGSITGKGKMVYNDGKQYSGTWKTAYGMDTEKWYIKTKTYIVEISSTDSEIYMEYIHGLTEPRMKANGKMTRCMTE